MPGVQLRQLTKHFRGGVPAVDEVTLEVEAARTVVILGPSGCGKTTLLRLVAGLERSTRGTVGIDGRDVTRLPPRDRDVAMVFQNPALYPHLNVRENLAFGLKLRGMDKAEIAVRISWAAGLLEIESLLARLPSELSGGQRQRVAIGRAIVRRPKVFLFDEPLSQLDAPLRQRMRAELKQLLTQLETTTLYVTHDHDEARELADVVCLMDAGRIRHVG